MLLVFAFGQALNDYVIQPRFLGDRVGLPAVWVIFSLFAGGAAFGFLGIMLAVPVTATLGVLARFWLRRYLHSPLYLDAPPDVDEATSPAFSPRRRPTRRRISAPPPPTPLARDWLARPDAWTNGRLVLWGEAGCGKTHLLHLWAASRSAEIMNGATLHGLIRPTQPPSRSTTRTSSPTRAPCCIC